MNKDKNDLFDEDLNEDSYSPYEEAKPLYHEESKDVCKSYVPLAIGVGIVIIIGYFCLKYSAHNPYFK